MRRPAGRKNSYNISSEPGRVSVSINLKGTCTVGFNADIKRALSDCIFFGHRYFPHLVTQPCSAFHHELIAIADNPAHDRISILAPRGHAKSTWLSIVYPIWNIVKNRNIKIIIVSGVIKQDEIDQLLKSGAQDFIKKPFDITDLVTRVCANLDIMQRSS